MLLTGKVVIVSGVGPGMGRHLAIHAAQEGARGLVITARRQENLDAIGKAVAEAGTGCEVLACVNDIRDLGGCERVAASTVERFGAIDALINNANVGLGGGGAKASEGELDVWMHPFEGNVIGTMKMCRAVLEQMKEQGRGFIVNVNTMGARMRPKADEVSYDAAKAALMSATRSLAYEVGQFGIHVNSVFPGSMYGPSTQRWVEGLAGTRTEEEIWERVARQTALRRVPTDEEVALATLFLASEYASACTGAMLDANGGAFLP